MSDTEQTAPTPPTASERFEEILASLEGLQFTPEELKGMHTRVERLSRAAQTFAYNQLGAFSTTVVLYQGHALVGSLEGEHLKTLESQLKDIDAFNASRPADVLPKTAILEFVSIPRIDEEPGKLANLARHTVMALQDYIDRNLNEPGAIV